MDVPASSANLGPGFDVLALALEMHLRVTVEIAPSGKASVQASGESAELIPRDESNRVLTAFAIGWRDGREGASLPALKVEMHNAIPIARGLGSSASATVAGLVAAQALRGLHPAAETLPHDRLLVLAAEIEGHPENAAAALEGGFVVCADGRVIRYDPPASLRAVVFIPDRQLSTAGMRAVLPTSVPHADAAHNVAASAQIVSAFATGDLSLLSAMNRDRLHEPYRATGYGELPSLLAAARTASLGAALSGAGSAIIALCDEERAASFVVDALSDEAARLGMTGQTRVLTAAGRGAHTVSDI